MDKKEPQVLEVEIIEPNKDEHSRGQRQSHYYYKSGAWSQPGFRGMWTVSPLQPGGCIAPGITLILFLMCLGQFGLLAAIGFFVFHLIGSVIGSVYQARQLMAGIVVNPWLWRAGNWIVAFLLTVWLAGPHD